MICVTDWPSQMHKLFCNSYWNHCRIQEVELRTGMTSSDSLNRKPGGSLCGLRNSDSQDAEHPDEEDF